MLRATELPNKTLKHPSVWQAPGVCMWVCLHHAEADPAVPTVDCLTTRVHRRADRVSTTAWQLINYPWTSYVPQLTNNAGRNIVNELAIMLRNKALKSKLGMARLCPARH